MSELKTKKTSASVLDFLKAVPDPAKRADALELNRIFREITGEKPAMWGSSIVGYGTYRYKSERSSQQGEWMLTGFSPRKQSVSLYILSGPNTHAALLKKLGPHSTGVGCLYINRLADIDTAVLKKIIKVSYQTMKKKHSS